MIVACTNTKNTALTRRIQAIKAHYNTYYNGELAFIDGRLAQEEGNKDVYSELLPVYITGNKNTVTLGKSNYDRAIEKCQKAIKQHTITKRPKWTKNRPKTQKDREWLSQKEYNPFLYHAWFLMGESQFRQGNYMEAASTFSHIQRQYITKPNIVARARVLEAKCYAELEWFYDAEDILRRAERDSFPTSYLPVKAQVYADMQVRQKQLEQALPNLQQAIKKELRPLEKTRLYFLMGQVCHRLGQQEEAYKYFTKAIRRNPPYDLEFNARIQRTEAMAKGRSKQMIRKLRAMAKKDKNKDYLDQVYYAIGNIYLSVNDTAHAIEAYEEGREKATRSGLEKGILLVHLGQLYWNKEKFVKAHKCYTEALGLFDREHEDYKQIDERTKILEELYPHANAVELQDSLQALARMDSTERMAVIKKIIEDFKKKEKEQQRQAAQKEQDKKSGAGTTVPGANLPGAQPGGQQAGFYFYNPASVSAGKNEFIRKWGDRKLEDNWRRANRTVLNDFNEEEADSTAAVENADGAAASGVDVPGGAGVVGTAGTTAGGDATTTDTEMSEEDKKAAERAADPHYPEYYLKDIPFTEEQMAASNAALSSGLFGSGVIYKDLMENMPLAERTFKRLLTDFPDFDQTDEVYYNLFQLYSRTERRDDADIFRQKLIDEYPENIHGKLIADPDFEFKGRYGKQIEDSLYTEAYTAYQNSDYGTVIQNSEKTATDYPEGTNRARFMFIEAMSRLETGERDGFMTRMKEIVEKFPESTVSELAGLFVKGMKEGRLLASGKFDMGDVWQRRRLLTDEDSLSSDTTFTDDRNCDFVFCIAYERDSINENQLLYEMARYNFTKFTVRNFDISFVKGDGIDMMQIRTFLNYDEAFIYLNRLFNNEEMAEKLEGLKCFIIAEPNLAKLMHGLSFTDYFDFYDYTFGEIDSHRLSDDEPSSLDEPTNMPEPREEDEDEEELEDEDNFIF